MILFYFNDKKVFICGVIIYYWGFISYCKERNLYNVSRFKVIWYKMSVVLYVLIYIIFYVFSFIKEYLWFIIKKNWIGKLVCFMISINFLM